MSKTSTHIPPDVCEHILEYIPCTSIKTLLALALVSKQWQVICTHDKHWKKIYYNRYSTALNSNYKFAYIQIRKTLAQHPKLFSTHQSATTKLDITVTGDGGVGKSSLCIHFCHNLFLYDIDPTIEDSYRKSIKVYDREITLELYDSYDFGYSSREDTIRKQKGFVLVFDLHDPNSLKQLYATVEEIYHAKNVEYGTVPMILVGNKADLEKTVEDQSIEKLMNQFHISCYIETSAKTGKNVQEMAQRIAKLLVERTIVPKEFCEKLSNGKPLIEKKCDIM